MNIEMMCPRCLNTQFKMENSISDDEQIFICEHCGSKNTAEELTYGSMFYVYEFYNVDWGVPFYVGKGSRNRYLEMSGRGTHIKNIFHNFDCEPRIIRYCSSEEESYKYEASIKKKYKECGYPIIDAETPSELRYMNQRAGIQKARAAGKYLGGKKKQIDYEKYTELINRYNSREEGITKSYMCEILCISRPTLDKIIKENIPKGASI